MIQILLVIVQVLVPVFFPFTPEQKIAIAAFVSSIQTIIGVKQQSVNPDGSKFQACNRPHLDELIEEANKGDKGGKQQ